MTSAELKTTRESLGLTADWLAKKAGVQLRTVRYWESGRNAVREAGKDFVQGFRHGDSSRLLIPSTAF